MRELVLLGVGLADLDRELGRRPLRPMISASLGVAAPIVQYTDARRPLPYDSVTATCSSAPLGSSVP